MKKNYKIFSISILIFIIISTFTINAMVKNILVNTIKDKTGKDMSISTLWINPFSGNISASNIYFGEDDSSIFSLKSLKLNSDPIELFKGNLHIHKIALNEPTLNTNKISKLNQDQPTNKTTNKLTYKKIESKEEKVEKVNFIKEIVVKNITVKNLVLEGNKSELKSLNTFTLKAPVFIYKNDILELSAVLEMSKNGSLELDLLANTSSGDISGSIISEELFLDIDLAHDKEKYTTNGNIIGNLKFTGNTFDSSYKTNGKLSIANLNIYTEDKTPLILSENIDIKLEELSYPNLKIIGTGNFNANLTSEVLPVILKNYPGFDIAFQGGSIDGTMDLNYPRLDIKPRVLAEEIIIQNTKSLPYKGSLKVLEGYYDIRTNFETNITSFSGRSDLNSLDFADVLGNSLFFRSGQATSHISTSTKSNGLVIKSLKFTEGEATLPKIKLTNITFDMSNITSKNLDSKLKISATGEDFANIDAKLDVITSDLKDLSDLEIKGNLDIDTISLSSLTKYFGDFGLDVNGIASYDSYINYSKDGFNTIGKLNGDSVTVKSENLDLDFTTILSTFELNLKDKVLSVHNANSDFTDVNGMITKNTKVNLPMGSLSIKEYSPKTINLNSLILKKPIITTYQREDTKETKDKVENQDSDIIEEAKTSKVSKLKIFRRNKKVEEEEEKDKKESTSLFIESLDLTGGTYNIVSGDKTTTYNDVGLKAENFTSNKGEEFTMDLIASIDKVDGLFLSGETTLINDWDFSLKTIDFSGDFGITNITISDFNDSINSSLPNEISRGTLSSKGSLKLKDGVVDSSNRITLSDVKLGEPTGVTSRVPLQHVLNTLKNNDGDITVVVPIKGDLNDPNFNITNAILNALVTNITNVLRNPEKAISSILAIGSRNREDVVYFDYLDSRPKSADIKKLSDTLDQLLEDPEATLEITLYTNEKVEQNIIRTKNIASSLFGSKGESSSEKLEELMDKRKNYLNDYFIYKIDESRIEIEISDKGKSLPQAKLKIKD